MLQSHNVIDFLVKYGINSSMFNTWEEVAGSPDYQKIVSNGWVVLAVQHRTTKQILISSQAEQGAREENATTALTHAINSLKMGKITGLQPIIQGELRFLAITKLSYEQSYAPRTARATR
jgi:hypothetical protein